MLQRPPPFPWGSVFAFCLKDLRIAPESIWQLTPREVALARAALAPPASAPPQRDQLDALMALYPDHLTELADDGFR
jgi:uncharacterized phage protein (TIGR02216 family)